MNGILPVYAHCSMHGQYLPVSHLVAIDSNVVVFLHTDEQLAARTLKPLQRAQHRPRRAIRSHGDIRVIKAGSRAQIGG